MSSKNNKLTPFDVLRREYPKLIEKINSEVSKVTFKKKPEEQERVINKRLKK